MSTTLSPVNNAHHAPVTGPMPRTPRWHALRTLNRSRARRPVVLDATDASAVVCGMSPHSTPLHLYLERRGELSRQLTAEQQQKMDFAAKLQPIILEACGKRTGVEVFGDQPMYFHPQHPWMACTPHGIAHRADDHSEYGIKCVATSFRRYDSSGANPHAYGQDGSDQVPVTCLLQTQWQMAVMGWDKVDVAALFDAATLRIYPITRDETIVDQLIAGGQQMVDAILNNDPPDPQWDHHDTRSALQALFGRHESAPAANFTDEQDNWWWQYRQLGEQIREIESRRTELHNRLLAEFHGGTQARLPGGQSLKRSVVPTQYVTEQDVVDLQQRIGQVKREGYERLSGPRHPPEQVRAADRSPVS